MSSQNYQILRQSLLERKPCRAFYDDLERFICAHVIGHKGSAEQTLVWQYAGESSKGLSPGGEWKCLTIAKVFQLQIIDDQWHAGRMGVTGKPSSCVDFDKVDLVIEM